MTTYEIVTFESRHGQDTYGVMAYAAGPDGPIPLGIDAHWVHRPDAEMALEHYQLGLAPHGRTTEQEHREIAARRVR